MPKIGHLLPVLLVLAACTATLPEHPMDPDSGTPPARPTTSAPSALAETINAYRRSHGLPRIPVSGQLNKVAEAHATDLEANYRRSARCNMHSWSTRGNWSPCCYTEDHAQKECMWNKPREITAGAYTATGYEIVAWYELPITPQRALEIWKASPGHHAMIRNLGQWSDNSWLAMGVAQSEHYAVIWFGEDRDGSP